MKKKTTKMEFLNSIARIVNDIHTLSMYEERTFENAGTHHEAKLFICINAIEDKNELQELVLTKKDILYKDDKIKDLQKRIARHLIVAKAINTAYQQEAIIEKNMQYLKNLI